MDNKIDEYIEKQQSPQREICKQLRQIIFKTFPNIKEKMKWGVPAYGNGKYYFVALKTNEYLYWHDKEEVFYKIHIYNGIPREKGETRKLLEQWREKYLKDKKE